MYPTEWTVNHTDRRHAEEIHLKMELWRPGSITDSNPNHIQTLHTCIFVHFQNVFLTINNMQDLIIWWRRFHHVTLTGPQIKLGTKTKQKHTKKQKKPNRQKKSFQKTPQTTESSLTISMNDSMLPLQEGKDVNQPTNQPQQRFCHSTRTLLCFSWYSNCTAHAFSSH